MGFGRSSWRGAWYVRGVSGRPLEYANRPLGGRLHWDDRGVVVDGNRGGAIEGNPWVSPGFATKLVYWYELHHIAPALAWPDFVLGVRVTGGRVDEDRFALSSELAFVDAPFDVDHARAWEEHVDAFVDRVRQRVPGAVRERGWITAPHVEPDPVDALPGVERRADAGGAFRSPASPGERVVWRWSSKPRSRRRAPKHRYGVVHPHELVLGEEYLYAVRDDVRVRFPRRAFRGFLEVADGGIVQVHRLLFGRRAFVSLERGVSEDLLDAMGLEAPRLARERAELGVEER